jgi:hypothetical protein
MVGARRILVIEDDAETAGQRDFAPSRRPVQPRPNP